MRNYEVAFIAQADLEEGAFTALVEKTKGWVTATGGQVTQVDLWGRRRLAYPIRKQNEGQYVLMQTQMSPATVRELERNLRLAEQVLRFQIIRVDD